MDIMKMLEKEKKGIDKAIAGIIPRRYDNKSMESTFGRPRYRYDENTATDAISKPVWDLLDRGGKRWRPTMFLLILEAFNVKSKDYLDIASAVEVIHNGTLMIDDIEDKSELRRGKPCTYKRFGVDIAINAGNAAYFLPMIVMKRDDISNDKKVKLYETYVQEMTNLSLGQGMDLYWHNGRKEPDEAEYLQMCAYKTGTLARMAARFAAIIAGLNDNQIERIGRFAETVGVAFQIQDDILNLTGSAGWGKTIGDDITEGKRSLMVIHTLKNASKTHKKRLLQILDMHTNKPQLIKEAIDIMNSYGALGYAKKRANAITSDAWDDVKELFPTGDAKQRIEAFVGFMVDRKI